MTSPQPVRQELTLSALVQMRTETDAEIPIVWLLLPLASYLLWAVFAVAWWSAGAGLGTSGLTPVISGLGILGITASAAGSYVVFRLVNRANEHSGRTQALLSSALGSLAARSGASGAQTLLPLNSAEESFYKLSRSERERSAVLWALLSFYRLDLSGGLTVAPLTRPRETQSPRERGLRRRGQNTKKYRNPRRPCSNYSSSYTRYFGLRSRHPFNSRTLLCICAWSRWLPHHDLLDGRCVLPILDRPIHQGSN